MVTPLLAPNVNTQGSQALKNVNFRNAVYRLLPASCQQTCPPSLEYVEVGAVCVFSP